jgi:tetratricopeptide (TPR) repeat protein/serine/threonine protein kinase
MGTADDSRNLHQQWWNDILKVAFRFFIMSGREAVGPFFGRKTPMSESPTPATNPSLPGPLGQDPVQSAAGQTPAASASDVAPSGFADDSCDLASFLVTDNDPFGTRFGPMEHSTARETKLLESIGRYRVKKLLGSGGFGRVYLAHDETLTRDVAVKVPHTDLVSNREAAEAYLTEARTAAKLDHANIVPVYDVGNTDEIPCFFVSKYVEGENLARRLERERLSFTESAELVAQVAEALHHAHTHSVVHRDVKPGNIMLDKKGKPFVVDFGLALRDEDAVDSNFGAGTPSYMSPEQAERKGYWGVDGRSDIFSLGAVLYELIALRLPFPGKTVEEVLMRVVSQDPRPPRMIDDTIPKELERICLKALSKRATERYTTALDMADDLRHFLNHGADSNSPTGATATSLGEFGSTAPVVNQEAGALLATSVTPLGIGVTTDRASSASTFEASGAPKPTDIMERSGNRTEPQSVSPTPSGARRRLWKVAAGFAGACLLGLVGFAVNPEFRGLFPGHGVDAGKPASSITMQASSVSMPASSVPKSVEELPNPPEAPRAEDREIAAERYDLLQKQFAERLRDWNSNGHPASLSLSIANRLDEVRKMLDHHETNGALVAAIDVPEQLGKFEVALAQRLDVKQAKTAAEGLASEPTLQAQWRQVEGSFTEADRLLGQGDLVNAQTLYKTVERELHEFRLAGLLLTADRALENRDLEGSSKAYDAVLELDANQGRAYVGRGAVSAAKGEYDRALAGYEEAQRHGIQLDELKPRLAAAHFERGKESALNKDFDSAIADFNEARRLDSQLALGQNLAASYVGRADQSVQKKEYDQAVADYDSAAREDSTLDLKSKRAIALSARGPELAGQADHAKVISDYEWRLQLAPHLNVRPQLAAAYAARGSDYLQRQEFELAVADLEAAERYDRKLDLKSKLAAAYIGRADGLLQEQDYDRSIAAYRHASELDSQAVIQEKLGAAYYQRGCATVGRGISNAAIADFTEAISLLPMHSEAYIARGIAYFQKKRFLKAGEDARHAVELSGSAEANRLYGLVLNELKKFAEAERYLSKAIDSGLSSDPLVFEGRGLANHHLGHYDQAIKDYSAAVKLDPKNPAAFRNRGASYLAHNEARKAIADSTKAIELDPKDALAFNNRAVQFSTIKDIDRALKDVTTALELDPKLALAYRNRGSFYNALKKFDRAIADCTTSISLDPSDAHAFHERAIAFIGLHQYSKAIADLTVAHERRPRDFHILENRANVFDAVGDKTAAEADRKQARELKRGQKASHQ